MKAPDSGARHLSLVFDVLFEQGALWHLLPSGCSARPRLSSATCRLSASSELRRPLSSSKAGETRFVPARVKGFFAHESLPKMPRAFIATSVQKPGPRAPAAREERRPSGNSRTARRFRLRSDDPASDRLSSKGLSGTPRPLYVPGTASAMLPWLRGTVSPGSWR